KVAIKRSRAVKPFDDLACDVRTHHGSSGHNIFDCLGQLSRGNAILQKITIGTCLERFKHQLAIRVVRQHEELRLEGRAHGSESSQTFNPVDAWEFDVHENNVRPTGGKGLERVFAGWVNTENTNGLSLGQGTRKQNAE